MNLDVTGQGNKLVGVKDLTGDELEESTEQRPRKGGWLDRRPG